MNLQVQGEETEDIVVGVRSFYHLYELCINYSLGINKIKSRITDDSPLKAPEQEESKDSDLNKLAQTMPAHQIDKLMNQRPTRRNTTLDEEHLCSICFEKQIQLVLPCLHGFCEDCCYGWYTKKKKTECPMCRAPIGEGDWDQKIFTVVSKSHSKKTKNEAVNGIATFINLRTRIIRV